jgi:hypothetical protein
MILEASRVKEHFPGLSICISIASLHVQLFFFQRRPIMDLIDRITKERKQESIMHVPRIRPTASTSVLIHLWQKTTLQTSY